MPTESAGLNKSCQIGQNGMLKTAGRFLSSYLKSEEADEDPHVSRLPLLTVIGSFEGSEVTLLYAISQHLDCELRE